MRLRPLPLLTLGLLFAMSAPATAAEVSVDVIDFAFAPKERQIAPGDRVTWTFSDGAHTTTAVRGQAERWDSSPGPNRFNAAGDRFSHTFERPGRFQYMCIPHASFMKGTIVVGKDEVRNTIGRVETVRRGDSVTVRFNLNEAAKVTYKLRGADRRSASRRRLRPGRRSITIRSLDPGEYRGTLTAVDDFDKRDTARSSFEIG
jgi:plastocyanin